MSFQFFLSLTCHLVERICLGFCRRYNHYHFASKRQILEFDLSCTLVGLSRQLKTHFPFAYRNANATVLLRLFIRHNSFMPSPSLYHRHRFPAEIISHCVWLYFRFSLSLRDVEEMLAMRGVSLSYETVREW